jgi:hypothetical protein
MNWNAIGAIGELSGGIIGVGGLWVEPELVKKRRIWRNRKTALSS